MTTSLKKSPPRPARRATGEMMLGDEAVALAAMHAGITCAYAYPGTPSTEIFARVIHEAARGHDVTAHWVTNEKAAYEQALGTCLAGRRALVTMKHVGLNVAADAFINSALLGLAGGLVIAVADDPGMHSSQNEQDTRYLVDFARVPCLEPATPQEAYDMTREAFEVSERFQLPVVVRLVTRLCHERGAVRLGPPCPQRPIRKAGPNRDWVLLPGNSRRLWRGLIEQEPEVRAWSEASQHNDPLREAIPEQAAGLGVITAGIARRYYQEVADQLDPRPAHLNLAAYPLPARALRRFAEEKRELLVIEEGYPFIERSLRGALPGPVRVRGRDTGDLPPCGELTVRDVRAAVGLERLPTRAPAPLALPARPPQLCDGCAHRDAYASVLTALQRLGEDTPHVVTGDIGCYTLGALPPYQAIDSCVCMGASIGMAKGASDAGLRPAIAVIGDSTFLHSGLAPLVDAVAHDTDMTLLILDNGTVAMTGGQPTALPGTRFVSLVLGMGANPEHVHRIDAHPRHVDTIAELIKSEVAHPGLSVIVIGRECIVSQRARKKERKQEQGS